MCTRELVAAIAAIAATGAFAAGPDLGKPITAAEIAAWDISVSPSGDGLPPGSGTAAQGAVIYAQKCVGCHGGDAAAGEDAQPRRVHHPLSRPVVAHSLLIPAARMIGHHLSISALWWARSASGVCCSGGMISWPRSDIFLRTSGSAIAAIIAALSRAITSFGVP